MNRLLTLLAVLFLSPLLTAQQGSKTRTGYLIDSNESRYARTLATPTTSETVNHSMHFQFPRWDGRDANGTFIGYERLEKVRFEVRLNMAVREWGENPAAAPSEWWQVNAGLSTYWSRSPDYTDVPLDTPLSFGGGGPIYWTDAGHSIGAFDGTLDGAGDSGHYAHLIGQPTFVEETWVSNAMPRELRAWSGPTNSLGDIYLNVRSETETLFPGHWRSWGDTVFSVRDVGQPGVRLLVTFFYSTAQNQTLSIVEQTPWIPVAPTLVDHTSPGQSLDLPGFSGALAQLRDARVEARSDYWSHVWLENLSAFPAICGGMATDGVSLNLGNAQLCGIAYNQPIGSGNQLMAAYDGTCDFEGLSGTYDYAGSGWPAWFSYQHSASQLTGLAVFVGPSVALVALTPWDSGAAYSETPGGEFAWGRRSLIGCRARGVYFH